MQFDERGPEWPQNVVYAGHIHPLWETRHSRLLQGSDAMTVYSIGYGGRCGAEVAELLSRFSITHLVDVRTSPYSRFDEDFSRNSLELVTQKWGVRYIFLGEALGGRPN